ncbi:hypothetical protein RJT34_21668 [Clitoria ternatea]|uniref:Uncharacterized protein n=1 Tax=Clitoria ternatea TaxID=43366 RepID=A0AAN9P5Z0_CLITE
MILLSASLEDISFWLSFLYRAFASKVKFFTNDVASLPRNYVDGHGSPSSHNYGGDWFHERWRLLLTVTASLPTKTRTWTTTHMDPLPVEHSMGTLDASSSSCSRFLE